MYIHHERLQQSTISLYFQTERNGMYFTKIYCYIKCTWQENTFKDGLMTFKNDAEVLKNRK